MSNNKKIIFISVILFTIGYWLFTISVSAAAETPTLKYEFPCTPIAGGTCPPDSATSPAAYIARFYQFALMIAGILAFGMLLWGAIKYTVSRGNASQIEDAKDIIWQALWGVALLLGAWLILFTIDPKLVSLTDPDITNLVPSSPLSPLATGVFGLTEPEKKDLIKIYSETNLDLDSLKAERETLVETTRGYLKEMTTIKNQNYRIMPKKEAEEIIRLSNLSKKIADKVEIIDAEIAKRKAAQTTE